MTNYLAKPCFGIFSVLVAFALLVPIHRLNASPHGFDHILGTVVSLLSIAWLLAGEVALLMYFIERPHQPHR
jgi:hypothetical protein